MSLASVFIPTRPPHRAQGTSEKGASDTLITPHETYLALGDDAEARRTAYRALFAQAIASDMLDTLRDAVQRGWALGGDRFQREIEIALGRSATPPRRGRPPKRRQAGEDRSGIRLV